MSRCCELHASGPHVQAPRTSESFGSVLGERTEQDVQDVPKAGARREALSDVAASQVWSRPGHCSHSRGRAGRDPATGGSAVIRTGENRTKCLPRFCVVISHHLCTAIACLKSLV